MGLPELLKKKMNESQAREDAIRKNPALANTPEMIALYRRQGGVIVILGCVVAIADALSWENVGRVFVFFIALPMVFIPLGVYMIVTGKNPLRKK